MEMAKTVRLLTLAMVLGASSLASAQPEPGSIRIPVAPPQIVILGADEPESAWREPPVAPENEIYLRRFDPNPANVEAAIASLRAALPRDWLDAVMREFGYLPNRNRNDAPSRRTDLREVDLARFLFDRWVLDDSETRLAREFSCLSWGEIDIGTFLTLVMHAEAGSPEDHDGWSLSATARASRLTLEAVQNARTAWMRCEQLVERGWTIRD